MRQAGEPSVEEILDSIKQVIARDNREIASAQRRRREGDGAKADITEDTDAEEGAEVLDLAEAGEVLAEQKAESQPADEIDDIPEDLDDEVAEEAEERAEEQTHDETLSDVESGLVDADAEESMRESLAALAMLAQPPQKPQIVRSGETSLEGLVRDMMRPMLKEWLDKNLPDMVEDMVSAEIARIAGKKSK